MSRPERAAALLAAVLGATALYGLVCRPAGIPPLPEGEVVLTATEKGVTYKVHGGNAYRVDTRTGRWHLVQRVYDPDFRAKHYVERDGAIFRKADDGTPVAVRRRFADGFEDAARLADLISLQRGWTSCTLQSPRAATVADYVALRKRILAEGADFLDNRLEPADRLAHAGTASLRAFSVPPARGMVTAKASLSTELLHFVKGDDVWISLWCRVPLDSGMPFTVLDLETTWIENHPGIRVAIHDGRHVCLQLKSIGNPYYRQPQGREIDFPRGRWVRLRVHLGLTEQDDGVIEVWQDDRKIIDTRGRTLVLADAIYNSLEVGVTAFNEQGRPATLFMDDVEISTEPIGE